MRRDMQFFAEFQPVLRLISLVLSLVPTLIGVSRPAAAATLQLVVLGDSLSAGYQLPQEDAFPAQLEKALKARGYDISVVNAGVSGDTASAGLERLDWSVPDGTGAVIVELGANDALRGIDPAITRESLRKILSHLAARHIPALLAGMLAPPNMGKEFTSRFNAIYPELAREARVPLYPFFLDGVAAQPTLQLADGMHPNKAGVAAIVGRILPVVEEFLKPIQGVARASP